MKAQAAFVASETIIDFASNQGDARGREFMAAYNACERRHVDGGMIFTGSERAVENLIEAAWPSVDPLSAFDALQRATVDAPVRPPQPDFIPSDGVYAWH